MTRWLLVPILLLGLGAATVAARDSTIVRVTTPTPIADCPADLVCVVWDGLTVELDPSYGPAQALITRRTTTTTETATGTTVSVEIEAVTFVQDAGSYYPASVYVGPATGVFEGAQFGDVYILSRSEAADD